MLDKGQEGQIKYLLSLSVLKNCIHFTYSLTILGTYCVQGSLLGCHRKTAMKRINDPSLREFTVHSERLIFKNNCENNCLK